MTAWFNDDRYQAYQQRLMRQLDGVVPTKVVCVTQAISSLIALLGDDQEYEEILDDMTGEGNRHGNLVKVVIPRPDLTDGAAPVAGVGKVFFEYADVESSIRAKTRMHERRFDGNQVVTMFYPENKYADGDYDYDG